ncbi:DUF1273 domain-containing protein [Halobacillus shinanisalinarum]|uniref:UPF0398 protein MUO14_00595 n=1 Tax=Halobacillus shinanisalinarum TaxID=2932258 RepID=A0ABY4H049_9BACI|nr:DUF1273 domain-containing protein [Halobacillus shinanisalinarum]UOQ93540.1 DUF1273 domain-containing protein [Halobacillus shinanisalinarum]
MKTIVVTGYKPMEMGIFKHDDPKVEFVKKTIRKRLVSLIEEGLEWIIISGQMGVELWTAEVVLDLKNDYPIQLGVIPPFQNQQTKWPDQLKLVYEEITEFADFYKPIYDKEYEGPYQFRAKDQFLIEHSDGCLLLFDEDTPGTPQYFLKLVKTFQEHHTYDILYITPSDLDETVEEIRMSHHDFWEE